jgi:hypothetical protein
MPGCEFWTLINEEHLKKQKEIGSLTGEDVNTEEVAHAAWARISRAGKGQMGYYWLVVVSLTGLLAFGKMEFHPTINGTAVEVRWGRISYIDEHGTWEIVKPGTISHFIHRLRRGRVGPKDAPETSSL